MRARRRAARPAEEEPASAEYTIDELARLAGTTVRNVRAYQDRGVLPPPERRGRTGIYTDVHLGRLRLIAQLLDRGYTLANIGELLSAWEQGRGLGQLLGLEAAVTSPWTDEAPAVLSTDELREKFGGAFSQPALSKALDTGVLERDGERFRVPSPQLLHVGAELAAAGVPMDALLDVVTSVRKHLDGVAEELVRLVAEHVFDRRYGPDRLPPPADAPALAELVLRLRPLARMTFNAEIAHAMERAATRVLGERLARVLDHRKPG